MEPPKLEALGNLLVLLSYQPILVCVLGVYCYYLLPPRISSMGSPLLLFSLCILLSCGSVIDCCFC